MGFTATADETMPVLIVGGGGAGLTASMLLARQGVEHLLVSARPTTSDLPKAHVLNQRSMEALEDAGVAEAIAERSTPAEQMAATAFYAGFAGPDADYGRALVRLITRWAVDAVLASKFKVGRVFLLGDAAHRHPPTGGLGLTSAILTRASRGCASARSNPTERRSSVPTGTSAGGPSQQPTIHAPG